MIKLQSDIRKNKESIISGHLVSCDKDGITEQPEEVAEILLCEKYAFLEFKKLDDNDIKKVEEVAPMHIEKGEPLFTPDIEPIDPSELIEEEEKSFEEVLESIDKIDELKAIAIELDLPKKEWEGYKRKDYFKNYLIESTKED